MPEAPSARTYVVRFASDAAGELRGRVTDVTTHRTRTLPKPRLVRERIFGSGFARAVVVRFDVDDAGNVTARAIDPATRRASAVAGAPELLVLLSDPG